MSAEEIALGDLLRIKHGFAFKGEHFASEGRAIVVTPGNFHEEGGFRRRAGKDKYYIGEIPDSFILKENDLIIAMTEQGEGLLGSSALVPNSEIFLHNQRIGLIHSVDEERADKKFLYYLFNTSSVRSQIRASASGTKVRHTAPERIYRVKALVPKLNAQQRIASILSTYDDLIENNRRRIALLEEAARQLYKEWFVRFRFPGHEHVKIVEGVPEGWERTAASNVLNVLSGGTPNTTTPQYWGGDIGFFTPKDAVTGCYVSVTEKTITEEGLAKCNSKLYPKDTLFITARGTVGKMNLAMAPMAMNQSCYALVSKSDMSQRLLYMTMDASLRQLRSQASGAVFDAIVVATFDRILVVRPDAQVAGAFDDFVDPIFDEIGNLGKQIEQLGKARDLLLPKLMSGAIAV